MFVSVVVVVAFGDALGLVAISVFGQNAERDTHTHRESNESNSNEKKMVLFVFHLLFIHYKKMKSKKIIHHWKDLFELFQLSGIRCLCYYLFKR